MMGQLEQLSALREAGRMAWTPGVRGWVAEPAEVVAALGADGFREYRREVVRSHRRADPSGGIWQGLDERTGAVASALWVSAPDAPHERTIVFIDIDGTPVREKGEGDLRRDGGVSGAGDDGDLALSRPATSREQ